MSNNFEKSIEGDINKLADHLILSNSYNQKSNIFLQIDGDNISSTEDLFTFLFELLLVLLKKLYNIDLFNLEKKDAQYFSLDNIDTLNTYFNSIGFKINMKIISNDILLNDYLNIDTNYLPKFDNKKDYLLNDISLNIKFCDTYLNIKFTYNT